MNNLHANDLHIWLAQQHHGLRTFRDFQQKLDALSGRNPDQRALCRLLSGIVILFGGLYLAALLAFVVLKTRSRSRTHA